ncbi:MAG: ABC transporter permease [Thermoleophilia bacterium]|nr:ABC transporter permease [Thermoleophilia bacterium]
MSVEQVVHVPSGHEPARRLREALTLLFANKLASIGALLAAAFVVVGVAGSVIVLVPGLDHLYTDQNLRAALLPPLAPDHVLGTDHLGRDLAWRVVTGSGISLMFGVAVTAISMAIGMVVGSIAGYYGGIADRLLSGAIDFTWGFPVILLAVVLGGMLSPGLLVVGIAVASVTWAGFARMIRAEAISLHEKEFVEAARALGVSGPRIIVRHLLPNMLGSTLVLGTYYVAAAIIVEASLSFIGLGAQPPMPSLGQLIATGRNFLSVDPWVAVVPGTAMALIVLGLNTFGDGLRDVFDPRLRRW